MAELPPDVSAAFAELALPPDLPAGELRRAYLRVVKLRKPETDPVGFRKAREAFDLLTHWFAHLPSRPPAPRTEAPAPAAPLEGWARLRPLLVANHIAEARQLICELLETKAQPPQPQELLLTILELQHKDPGQHSRPVLSAFLRWVDRAGLELAFASQPERWLLAKSLARLPRETPLEVERLLVLAVLVGGLSTTLKAIETFTRAHPEKSDALILPLSDADPMLFQLLTPVLNIEIIKARDAGVVSARAPEERERPATSNRAPMWLVLFFISMLFKAFTASNSCSSEPTYDELAYPTKPWVRPASALPPKPVFVADGPPPTPPPQGSQMGELCARSFDDCTAAKAIESDLNAGRCAEARAGHQKLSNSSTLDLQGPAERTLRAMLDVLSFRLQTCRSP